MPETVKNSKLGFTAKHGGKEVGSKKGSRGGGAECGCIASIS